jgi:molybdenum cofactor guanylyltransferase
MKKISQNQIAGVVLCGGASIRMGRPKLSLSFGDETMLARVVRIVGEVVSPVVVVAAPEQELPLLPAKTLIARDEIANQGPLAGLAAGMTVLESSIQAVYASSCDVPLLQALFVQTMVDALGERESVIPRDGQYHHPLAAVYRTSLLPRIRQLIADRRLSASLLVEVSDSRTIDVDQLRSVDPDLASLRNVNTLDEYREALRTAGFNCPAWAAR